MSAVATPAVVIALSASAQLAASEERLLSEALSGHQDKYPGVSVKRKVMHGGTREALIDASRITRRIGDRRPR
ncbi:hypothetical protein [Streptomyces sp.]|uniref:hypothetical protein n=1 Tax=Streptomyces sp. TaxID=1931 RepID=UPI002D795DA1|nr:hypothetical protein [Streptomyces sp.]HET6358083.1 hypothetical protein [Streptomyces sp.]